MSPLDIVIRLVVATLAGAILGWERESHHKPAGLKTHMLVSLGAAVFMVSALQFFYDHTGRLSGTETDVLKVVAGIVGGVGFLGAGSVIRSGGSVQGLTTAATIWLSAALGVASGLGHYVIVSTCIAVALAILLILGTWANTYFQPSSPEDQTESPENQTKTDSPA